MTVVRVGYICSTAHWTLSTDGLFSSQIQYIWKLTQPRPHRTASIHCPLGPSMIPLVWGGLCLKSIHHLVCVCGVFSLISSNLRSVFHNTCFICPFLSIPPAHILSQNFLINFLSQTPLVSWLCRLFSLLLFPVHLWGVNSSPSSSIKPSLRTLQLLSPPSKQTTYLILTIKTEFGKEWDNPEWLPILQRRKLKSQCVLWLTQGHTHTTHLRQRSSRTQHSLLLVQITDSTVRPSAPWKRKIMLFISLQPPKCPAKHYVHSNCSINETKMEGERERSGMGKRKGGNKECPAKLAKLRNPPRSWAGQPPGPTARPALCRGEERKPAPGSHLETTGTLCPSL